MLSKTVLSDIVQDTILKGLFSIILATGLGSFASERIVLDTPARIIVWSIILALYLGLLPSWFPILAARMESAGLLARGLTCVVVIMPAGVLMGFGFPTGMRLVNAIDSPAKAREVFGDNPVFVAFGPDAVLVALGANGLAALKEAAALEPAAHTRSRSPSGRRMPASNGPARRPHG